MSPLLLAIISALLAFITHTLLYTGHRTKSLPAGPPTLPLIGNLHQIPKKGAHFQFTKWAREYGGIYSLKLGTGTAVVLTSRQIVKELLDKRSAFYAARPSSYVANLISGGDHILLMQYGPQWRETRKLLHGTFMEKVVDTEHLPLQEVEARQMMRDYLLHPEDHMAHPKRYSNSIIMSLVWGIRTPSTKTRHMQRLYEVMEVWSKVMETGATPPVDVYPFLHWLPQGVFLNWRDRADHVRKEMNGLYAGFLSGIRERRANEGSRGTFMDKVLDQVEGERSKLGDGGMNFNDHELYFMGGTVTEGGSDTSASIITAFMQAMVAYPDVQKKARAELDNVVGPDRSPNWSDYPKLPYLARCVKEAQRWRPVTPLAFPHALTQDDTVVDPATGQTYTLPAGATIIVNAWGLQHDPETFPDPTNFNPDNYADFSTKPAPELANGGWEGRDHYGYGAGRRFCPGAHLAERNLFLAMAKAVWAFAILPKDGKKVDVRAKTGYSEGFLVCAKDFEAEYKVRGEERRRTILKEFEESEWMFRKYGENGL